MTLIDYYIEHIYDSHFNLPSEPLFEGIMQIVLGTSSCFVGTASDLLLELDKLGISGLPSAPNKLSSTLTRITDNLREEGISVEKRRGPKGERLISICR